MREREDRLAEVVGRRRRQCIFSSGAIGDVAGCGSVARMREASRGGSVGGGGLCSTRGGGAGHQAGGETGGENRRRERRLCFSRPRKKKVKARVVS